MRLQTTPAVPAQGSSAGAHDTEPRALDAIVVGAGVVGLTIAWQAARAGLGVAVLDAAEPGSGASRAAAGMLAPVTEADFGEQPLIELNLAGAARFPSFASELEAETGMETGYLRTGTLTVATDRDQHEELDRLHEFQLRLGLDVQRLSARECRRLEPGLATRVAGGVHAPGDHQVAPRRLVAALRAALERSEVELRAGTGPAALVVEDGSAVGVRLPDGQCMLAGRVVVAAGAASGTIAGIPAEAQLAVRPVKGQILRLRGTPGQVAGRVIRTPEVYAVPRADGTVVVGATVEERGWDEAVTAGGVLELLRRAYEVLPGVTELELMEASAGLRPTAPDNRPVVGESDLPGLVWATGHWRNGVLLAPLTADAIVAQLAGDALPEVWRGCEPQRFAAARSQVPGPRSQVTGHR